MFDAPDDIPSLKEGAKRCIAYYEMRIRIIMVSIWR